MNIHEYQAKELLAAYGIPVGSGAVAKEASDIPNALQSIPLGRVVVKAQIHAGGRGKGTFTDGLKGGVQLVETHTEATALAEKMLGNTLVTQQTGPSGRLVKTVYFCEPSSISKEYYVAMIMDRETGGPMLIASQEGGVDIEHVADTTPERIVKVPITLGTGVQPYHCRLFAHAMGWSGALAKQSEVILRGLYQLLTERDASMVEINPLVTTTSGLIEALDAKISFEDNALFRQAEILALRDLNEEDPKEIAASQFGLSYVALDGNIACLVNGAGLAMATMDIIKHFGGSPANFLDVGGGANTEQVTQAFRIILTDANVKGILVNIFGGIMSCKTIAEGVVAAAREVNLTVPLVVRLEGNEVAEGKLLLAQSGIALTPADNLSDAAQKIVALVRSQPSL
jgi:succinyl-CoA synthetase beta subunit